MIPRERVKRALAKQKVDRIPVYMWFHPETTRRLANLLEVPPALVSQAMGNDIRQTWVNNNYAMEGITHEHDGESHVDYWGIGWTKQFGFNQITSYPLAGCSTEKVLEHALPLSRITDLLAPMVPLSRSVGDYYLGCDVSPCAFEMYWRLRGMEDALLDIASDPALAYEMLGRCADFSIELAKVACNRYQLDWLWTGDDIGSQQAMMMNPEAWRRLIKPHLARVFAVIHVEH
jgi:uroporphyrinogen decarboxylase